ncbi:hypothetical protein BKA66DRAFT_456959 [Pyrenochaeta sp. MPI-SDFR-AT-0127]|nr:hypothetical protein BKA66DRAFT_456959 [Pyrenochaeta sp. MPI-SDFR-AT-0127]
MTRASLPLWICSSLCLQPCYAAQYGPLMAPIVSRTLNSSLFSINSTWQVLGPFQIGTREASWGADPLEYAGGFRSVSYDPQATFRSSLPTNGTARWNLTKSVRTSSDPTSCNASLSISYSNVDWNFFKDIYGWAAVQYQAWARGELIVGGNETQHVILHTDAILEYWIDDTHYFGGDFYTFRKAPPVLHLKPGSHKIDIRLVRDVRAFGGILEPTIDVIVDVRQVSGTLELAKPGILISDIVDGKLAATTGSVYLRNSGEDDIEIVGIKPSNASITPPVSHNNYDLTIVAGQTRPIAFNISLLTNNASFIAYNITYKATNSTQHSTLQVSQQLNHVSMYRPHKVTFLHPGGMASYAMLRAPAKNASCQSHQTRLPVLLALHGAGLEADSPMVTSALDPVSDLCAWVLFPTGVTPWSGDDWHNWGFADVEAAVKAVPDWIETVGWRGAGVDTNRWIVSGHSNGGQGTFYALTHKPDKILAAAPVSGYSSIQKYVPYELWQPADPRRTAVVSASLNSYRHEMLMANVNGIPIQQQHGEIDDNVPAYNSRLLAQQIYLAGSNSSYNEVENQNHWWELVMTTPELVEFYYEQTRNQDVLPRKLTEFHIVVGDPGDMGAKGGIRVTHLKDPGQYGRVSVKGHTIKTSNVQSLEFDPILWSGAITLNGQNLQLAQSVIASGSPVHVYISGDTWSIGALHKADMKPQRHTRQLGSMTALLRTKGPFVIHQPHSTNTSHLALQISRNLHQYFQADSVITNSLPLNSSGNVITLAVGFSLEGLSSDFPIHVTDSGISIRDHQGREQRYGEEARGAAFLRPLEGERLDLVLWGADLQGLQQAARMVPMLTGVGQPDFVLFGESARWKGIEGALAMGFFDSNWEVTASSVVESG